MEFFSLRSTCLETLGVSRVGLGGRGAVMRSARCFFFFVYD